MKTETSIYGAIALFTIIVSSVFSYMWSTFGTAAYGYAALALGAAFVYAIARMIEQTERRERAAITKVDFHRPDLHKAA